MCLFLTYMFFRLQITLFIAVPLYTTNVPYHRTICQISVSFLFQKLVKKKTPFALGVPDHGHATTRNVVPNIFWPKQGNSSCVPSWEECKWDGILDFHFGWNCTNYFWRTSKTQLIWHEWRWFNEKDVSGWPILYFKAKFTRPIL